MLDRERPKNSEFVLIWARLRGLSFEFARQIVA